MIDYLLVMVVLHGEDIVSSRERLNQLVTEAKLADKEVLRLDGTKVSLSEVKQAWESPSLFGQERLVVIEGLFSRQQSKEKKAIFDYLKSEVSKPVTSNVILWDGKQLTASQLKGFPKQGIEEFKLPVAIFKFLDGFAPGQARQNLLLFEETLKYQPVEMVFGMLIKRLRYLLVAREGGLKCLSEFKELRDWQNKRILSQARRFAQGQLEELVEELLEMDYAIKTGKTNLDLRHQLELLMGGL